MSGLAIPAAHFDAYLANVVEGRPMREIARLTGVEPSTVLRRVRRIEELRDHPEWEALIDALETERESREGAPPSPTDRPQVAAALGLDLDQVHAALAAVLPALTRAGARLAVADLPRAAVTEGGCTRATLPRAAALAAVAFGWVTPAPETTRKVRLFVASATAGECLAPSSATSAAAHPLTPAPQSCRRARRYTPLPPPLERMRRRGDNPLLTPDRLRLAREFHEIYAQRHNGLGQAWAEIAAALAPSTLRLLEAVCGEHEGFEATEARLGLPARSAKALTLFALDAYAHAVRRAP